MPAVISSPYVSFELEHLSRRFVLGFANRLTNHTKNHRHRNYHYFSDLHCSVLIVLFTSTSEQSRHPVTFRCVRPGKTGDVAARRRESWNTAAPGASVQNRVGRQAPECWLRAWSPTLEAATERVCACDSLTAPGTSGYTTTPAVMHQVKG